MLWKYRDIAIVYIKRIHKKSFNQKKKTCLNKKIYPFDSNTFNFFIRIYSRASLQLLTPLTASTIIIETILFDSFLFLSYYFYLYSFLYKLLFFCIALYIWITNILFSLFLKKNIIAMNHRKEAKGYLYILLLQYWERNKLCDLLIIILPFLSSLTHSLLLIQLRYNI